MKGAVRTMLECLGEDPEREGLLGTPERYAKAMLFFTKGYQQNVRDIVGGAIFHEGHNELVIVKDIEVFSLCEHHMVPFTGKVSVTYINWDWSMLIIADAYWLYSRQRCYWDLEAASHSRYVLSQTPDPRASYQRRRTCCNGSFEAPRCRCRYGV